METELEFKNIIKEFLNENGITQSDFARKIGIKPGLVNDWVRGKAKPGYDNLKMMAKVFNVPANYFLGLTEEY